MTNATEELRQPNVDRAALERIALASQGQLVELPDLAIIEPRLEGRRKQLEAEQRKELKECCHRGCAAG